MDELDVLEPGVHPADYRGERLQLRPLTIGMVPKIVRVARPVIDHLLQLDKLPEDGGNDMVTVVIDLIEKHAEGVFAAVSIATGREQVWIEGGDPAEFIELALSVFRVNRDFFDQRLGPLLAEIRASRGRGPIPSSSSSNAATPSPTSAATPSPSSGPSL